MGSFTTILGDINNVSELIAYRPPEWVLRQPPLTIVVPPGVTTPSEGLASAVASAVAGALGIGSSGNGPTVYVFDTAWSINHEKELVITHEPVQTGAAITDHFYRLPARITAQIGMSDCMASYNTGQFSGAPSRSVSAFQTLLAIQDSGALLQVATRLGTYSNMLIQSIRPDDTPDTRFGLLCTVVFEEILIADNVTSSQNSPNSDVSARPDATGSAPSGTTLTQNVSQNMTNQHNIAGQPADVLLDGQTVPGAGDWDSENVVGLATSLAP